MPDPALAQRSDDQLARIGATEQCPHRSCRVEVVRENTGETLVFLNNQHDMVASSMPLSIKVGESLNCSSKR